VIPTLVVLRSDYRRGWVSLSTIPSSESGASRIYLSAVTLNRGPVEQVKGAEKAVYTTESQQGMLFVLPALLWFLMQFTAQSGALRLVGLVAFAAFVIWGGVASAIASTSWYRLGLDTRLIELSSAGRTGRLLNAFCGTGSLAVSFGKSIVSGEVVATDRWKPTKKQPDPSGRVRDNIRIEGVGHVVRVQEADPLQLPFKAGYFNVVGSRFGLSSSRKDRRKALLELLRVLKPGGYLVLAESLPVALWLKYGVLAKLASEYKVVDVRLSRFQFTSVVSAQKLG
jgi:SAM-dependent methyltransferase